MLVDVVKIAHARPRKAEELPADQIRVAAVHGIAEHAFNRVGTQKREKQRVFNLFQAGILLGGAQQVETAQLLEARAIDLTRRFFALIALLGNAIRKGRLRVAIMIAAVGRGELPVDVDDDAGLVRSRTGFVARKNACRRSGNGESFFFREKAQGNFDGAGLGATLSMDAARLAIKCVHEHAAQCGGGDSQEMTPAHC